MHALDELREQQMRAHQRVLALLCRHGIVWKERTPPGRQKRLFRVFSG